MVFSTIKKASPGFKLYLANSIIGTFSFAFIPIYFFEKSFTFPQLILIYALYTFLSIIFISLVKTFHVKRSITAGFIISGLAALSLSLGNKYAVYLYSILIAFNILFFWIPLNYVFFRNSERKTNAFDSSWYIIISGIVGVIIPPISAFVIRNYGYNYVFFGTFMLYLAVAFILRNLISDEKIISPTIESIKSYKKLKTITCIEGSLHFFSAAIIPVSTLMFFKTESEFGFFLSYIGLIGLVIALILAKISDHKQERKLYIAVLLVLMALSAIILSFAKTKLVWIIFVGLYTIFYTISYPLRSAIVIDFKKAELGLWKAREIFLNVGRAITLSLSALLFYLHLDSLIFFMYATIILLYIFLIYHKLEGIK